VGAIADEQVDVYDAAHLHHPMIRFLIMAEHQQNKPIPVLSFRVCFQREVGFMQQLTRLDGIGVFGAVPEGVDPNNESLLPPILPVSMDPGHIGYVELISWRHHFTD